MAERGKDERSDNMGKLDAIIKKHEELIPTVLKTQVKVDLYWKCYAYGDELKPHIEFLDGIMLSSTRDIAPSCVENVDELTERQEKSLSNSTKLKNRLKRSRSASTYNPRSKIWNADKRYLQLPRAQLMACGINSIRTLIQ